MKNLYAYFLLFFWLSPVFGLAQSPVLPQEELPSTPKTVKGQVVLRLVSHSNERNVSFSERLQALLPSASSRALITNSPKQTTARSREIAETLVKVHFAEDYPVTKAIAQLRKLEGVAYVEPVYEHHLMEMPEALPPFIPNDPLRSSQWYLSNIQAYDAWGVTTGSSTIKVGVIDTGIKLNHPDLQNKLAGNPAEQAGTPGVDDDGNGYIDDVMGWDFGDNDNNADDNHYHGTCVAGLVGAETNNSVGIAGVGYQTRVVPLNVMQASTGRIINMYDAILYAAENGCQIANLSLGRPGGYLQWEQDIINYVTDTYDILIVAAAGNTHAVIDYYPASYHNVMSVVHSSSNDWHTGNATLSRFIDFMAPGGSVRTTFNPSFGGFGISYYDVTGSSFASPISAGAAALLRAHFPSYTAPQICELLRATTDNTLGLPGNAPHHELLGTGRLNIFRALDEEPLARSLRMVDFSYENDHGNFAAAGDTLSIFCDYTNFLQPLSAATRVVLHSASPYVTVLADSVFMPGTLANMQDTSMTLPFRIVLAPNTPTDTEIYLRLGFSDIGTSYTGRQHFKFLANPSYLDLNFNELGLSLSNRGRVGYHDENYFWGTGITWNGREILGESGLIVATRSGGLSNALQDTLSVPSRDRDFTPIIEAGKGNPEVLENTPSVLRATTYFADTSAQSLSPVGLAIRQEFVGYRSTPYRNFVIVKYEFENLTASTIDTLQVGYYADWNMATDSVDFARWDATGNFGYVYQGAEYAAVKALKTNRFTYFAFDHENVGGNNINPADQFTRAEKHQALSGYMQRLQAGNIAPGNDVSHVVGTYLTNLAPGATDSAFFALAVGSNAIELREATRLADSLLSPNPTIGPQPILPDTVFCAEGPFDVAPSNGSLFYFYDASNLSVPLHMGSSYTLNLPADTLRTFHITNMDSTLESPPRIVKFRVHKAQADFTGPSSLNLTSGSAIAAFTDQSTNAVSWEWHFGDGGTSNVQNPIYAYTAQGSYTVELYITDDFGCRDTASLALNTLGQSPVPTHPGIVQGCTDDTLFVQPMGGRNFNFYESDFSPTPLHTGRDYLVIDPALTEVYISCIDSALESSRLRVRLVRHLLSADFEAVPEVDTIIVQQVDFRNLTQHTSLRINYTWDFGDGSPLVRTPNPRHTFPRQGEYRVTLRAEDAVGCISEITKTYYVGKQAPKPEHSGVLLCAGEGVTLRPRGGSRFAFYRNGDGTGLLGTGATLTLDGADSLFPNGVYITCLDSVVESEPLFVPFNIERPRAEMDFSREVYLPDNPVATFTDLSFNAHSWFWDFGDGQTSTARNPQHRYAAQGRYRVTLTMTTQRGCQDSVSGFINVYARAPRPVLDTPQYICRGDMALFAPQNGTRFRFYASEFGSPIHEGNSYQTQRLWESSSYFITCIDSAIESLPLEVPVRFSQPAAGFNLSKDTLNLFLEDTVNFSADEASAVRWIWEFGDGRAAEGPNHTLNYSDTGSYVITLIAQDTLGCLDTARRRLTVINTPVITGVEADAEFATVLYPNPTSSEAMLVVQFAQPRVLRLELVSSLGQVIAVQERESTRNVAFQLDLKKQPPGLYLLRLHLGGEEVRQFKLVRE